MNLTFKINTMNLHLYLKRKVVSRIAFLMMGILAMSFSAQAQTSKEYTDAEAGALVDDIEANAYSEYILTTDGGTYVFSDADLAGDVIIKAQDGLVNKPVITDAENSSGYRNFFDVQDGAFSLTIEGVAFDGTAVEPMMGIARMRSDNSSITIRDCEIYNFTTSNGVMRADKPGVAVTVEGTYIHDSNQRLIYLYDPSAAYGAVNVTNCTFANMTGPAAIYYRTSGGSTATGTDLIVDHCTFYNIPDGSKRVIEVGDEMTGTVSLTNSLFVNVGDSLENIPVIDYCYLGGFEKTVEGTNSLTTAPVFEDAENGDFSVVNAADLMGSDSETAGDLSWGVATTSENEYTAEDVARLIADINNNAHEEYILVTSGGVYDFTEAPDVTVTSTIKGAAGLEARPVLSFTSNPNNWAGIFRVRNTSEMITLTLENLEFDQSNEIGLLVRMDDPANIVVKDCYIHGNTNSNGLIRKQAGGGTVTIENTLVSDCKQRVVNLYTPDDIYGAVNLKNSTFTDIDGPVIYYRSSGTVAIGTDVTVDHVTFNNIGGSEGVFKFRDMTGLVVVKNSIFSNVAGSLEEEFVVADYCYVGGFETAPVATNSIETAPEFADAENNNFTLINADAMIAGDMQILGDLSWYNDVYPPKVYEELVKEDETHLRVQFNEIIDTETAAVAANYTLSGTFGLTGNPTEAVVAEDAMSVVLEVPDLSTIETNQTVVVTVENVTDVLGNAIEESNVATYTYLDETAPVISMEVLELTNENGVIATVQSSEAGMVYLVMDGEEQASVSDFEAAIENRKGASAVVETANTDVQVSVAGLLVGTYHAYAVDAYENISLQSENTVVITDPVAPEVTLEAQEVTNAANADGVMVASTEPGAIYLVLEGEVASTLSELEAAVDAAKGVMGTIELDGELEIAVSMAGVTPGNYYAYAVDMAGNISVVSEAVVAVTEYVPRVRYYTDEETDQLSNDIISANDGDVFVLTTSGGDYALSAWHKLTAKITIMADEDVTERPVLSNFQESSTYQMFRLYADGASLTLKGLEIDSKEHALYPMKYMIRAESNIGNYSIVAEDCHFHGTLKATGTIVKTYGGTYGDSLIFRNCIFEDMEAISMTGLSSEDSPQWDKLEISNCTFMNIPERVIAVRDQPSVNKEYPINIDHCTFYNVGSEDDDIIIADSMTMVTVTNSIFTNSPSPTIFDVYGDETGQSSIDYFNYYEVNTPVADGTGVVGANVWNQDPQFANAEEGDLTLGNTELFTLGSDGLPLGDLRWADVLGPKVKQEVLALTDSTLLIRFDEWIDTTTAINPDNYTMSGTAGISGTVSNVELYNFHAVVVTTGSFIGLTGLELTITVSGVEDLNGNAIDDAYNSVTYMVEQLLPVVFAEEQQATNASGETVIAQSSLGSGEIYIVLDGIAQETVADLDAAVAAGNGAKAPTVASYTDVEISTYAITPGMYYAYYVDGSGNMSDKDESPITITDGIAPDVSAEIQSATNGDDASVMVQSSEDNGKVYIVLDGVAQSTNADFITAVALKNAAVANVTAANTDVEISTSGLTAGIYYAYAIDAAGNISAMGENPINITIETGVDDLVENMLKVYTVNRRIRVTSDQDMIRSVAIYDLTGRNIVNQKNLNDIRYETDILKSGVYIVNAITVNDDLIIEKIVIK
jgi:hypothetical protein